MSQLIARWLHGWKVLMMSSTLIDARLAGGHLDVHTAALPYDETMPVVAVSGPGFDLVLFPHEATALADALRAAGSAR